MRTHRESWEPGKQMPLRYLGIAKLDRADGVGHPIGTDVERIGKAAPRAEDFLIAGFPPWPHSDQAAGALAASAANELSAPHAFHIPQSSPDARRLWRSPRSSPTRTSAAVGGQTTNPARAHPGGALPIAESCQPLQLPATWAYGGRGETFTPRSVDLGRTSCLSPHLVSASVCFAGSTCTTSGFDVRTRRRGLPAVQACGKDLYDVERHEPDIIGGFAGGGGGF